MEPLFCPSQYFINKQNVRSFQNLMKGKLPNNGDINKFLKNIFVEEKMVSALPTPFCDLLFELKSNLKREAVDDFKSWFVIKEETIKLTPVSKEFVFSSCLSALHKIIPKSFFGNNHNSKIFRMLIHDIVFTMKGENKNIIQIIQKWNFDPAPWESIEHVDKSEILQRTLLWILRNILAPMICLNFYVSTTKMSADENKLYFFWKNEWQSFYDRSIARMIAANLIQKNNTHCITKIMRKKISLAQHLARKAIKKEIPKLYLVLKGNNEFRPIVRYKYEQNIVDKKKIKDRLSLLRALTGRSQIKIELSYQELYKKWENLDKPKLYFVKTDLSNAFGSVVKEKLMKILAERHMNFQKNEKNIQVKKKVAQMYMDLVSELKKPLLVRAGSTVYEWKRGLVQGYKYSPALSELYYTYMDRQNFSTLMENSKPNIKFLARVVDDYLFITDCQETAQGFLDALFSYSNVNYKKTVVNFPHDGITISNKVVFLGYEYNTTNLQVSRANNLFSGQMCFKILFSTAITNLHKFLANRIGQSGIQINGHIFNLRYNSEDLVWRHIFATFCLSANKFCTILAIVCEESEMRKYLATYKKKVVFKLGRAMVDTLLKNKPDGYIFRYCVNHFRYLSWKALQLCAKKTSRCCGIIPAIDVELAKCNCIFGKWREHFSRVDLDGSGTMEACRDICRRTDLRAIMKTFDSLPSEYKLYNNKSRL